MLDAFFLIIPISFIGWICGILLLKKLGAFERKDKGTKKMTKDNEDVCGECGEILSKKRVANHTYLDCIKFKRGFNSALDEFSERLIEYLQGCNTDMREALYGVDKIAKEMRK